MQRALLVVDYSNDFVHEAGALSAGLAGQVLDGPILAEIERAHAAGEFIFVCHDEHTADDAYHPEAALFPAHHVKGGWGAEFYGASGRLLKQLLEDGDQHVIYVPKQRYSAFFGTPLDMMLRARGVQQLTVVGLCTDICVLHTVIDATYLGYRVRVPEAACATIMPHGQEWALAHMKNCLGVEIV